MLSALLALVFLCSGQAQSPGAHSSSPTAAAPRAVSSLPLSRTRLHPDDLQLGGDLAGVPAGETRFVSYADLLTLPQVTVTVLHDENFAKPVTASGIPLDQLAALLGAAPGTDMITAICKDLYAAHYTPEYLQTHHPLLVLKINGQEAAHWPLAMEGVTMGPYMISHADFQSSHSALAHTEQPQVPWGVKRLDFAREVDVYRPILPIGPEANSKLVQQGYLIARENCFRCHDSHGQGGKKSGRSWSVIAKRSIADPEWFAKYIRNPTSLNPSSQMAASPEYDDATIAALRAYFAPFAQVE